MAGVVQFPADKYDTGSEKQAPAEKIAYEQHGRKHHKMPPVIDPAVDAAAVLHDLKLKRTVKQNADIIRQEIQHCQHKEINIFNYAQ